MAGTKEGGRKAAQTNKERNGADFYKRIGMKGGRLSHTGGFASNPSLARRAGAKGGRVSRRAKRISQETLNQVRQYIIDNPATAFKDVAEECGVGLHIVRKVVGQLIQEGYKL